ncbi:DUF7470 family protein [Halocatena marina]|uniref:Uncharacterized protein n=1 Tax=Halocatena marina TaxID=2934937 RepID=A0ABD5YS49_9EURY|nr:hypothetical protein [Halocatena marina]
MIDKLGRSGIVGVLVILGGLALIALANPMIAGGLVLVLVGVGLIVHSLLKFALNALGMGGML